VGDRKGIQPAKGCNTCYNSETSDGTKAGELATCVYLKNG